MGVKIITAEQLKKVGKDGLTLEADLNDVIHIHTKRPNGRVRIQQDFQFCPTLTEQHTAHMTDINYLMEKYKPDELAQYLAARTSHRVEILGHDFSQEPSLQDAKNAMYESRKAFERIPPEIRHQFRNYFEFLKFVDNPDNADKLVKMGILTQEQIDAVRIELQPPEPKAKKKETDAKERSKDSNDDAGGGAPQA